MNTGMIDQVVVIVAICLLMLFNAGGVVMVFLQLPGTWIIVLLTTITAWWRWEEHTIPIWGLITLVALALLGEIAELVAGARGARKAGASRRAALLAIGGAVVGAVVGSAVLILIGTLIGACVGAAAGSFIGDRWAGRSHDQAFTASIGAAKGRFVGTLIKTGIAILMWITVLASVLLAN